MIVRLWLGAALTVWFWLLAGTVTLPSVASQRVPVPVTREQCERLGGDWLVRVDVGRCVKADR